MSDEYNRFRDWLSDGPGISLRTFLFSYILLFALNTFLIGAVMYFYRENQHRIKDVKAAVVQACRDNNVVRSEERQTIQDLKNHPDPTLGTLGLLQRYDALTRAQARLADKRCIPLRTK